MTSFAAEKWRVSPATSALTPRQSPALISSRVTVVFGNNVRLLRVRAATGRRGRRDLPHIDVDVDVLLAGRAREVRDIVDVEMLGLAQRLRGLDEADGDGWPSAGLRVAIMPEPPRNSLAAGVAFDPFKPLMIEAKPQFGPATASQVS